MSKLKHFGERFSVFFFILMALVLFGSYNLRLTVTKPTSLTSQIDFFSKFAIPEDFLTSNVTLVLNFEFLLGLALLILAYFLGKEIASKATGLFMAVFLGFYPYFISNCYGTINFFLLFFMLYLFFQLKANTLLSKAWSVPSGIFFILSVILEPTCIVIGIISYIYYAIKSRNIIVLRIFLFFLLGILIGFAPFMIYALLSETSLEYILPLVETYTTFVDNFNLFISAPIDYFNDEIIPFFANTLGEPSYYISLNSYAYLHYVIVTLSVLGFLYAFKDEKIRIIFLILLVLLLQALFIPVGFELLFLLLIIMASYMINKVVSDVFTW